MSTWILVWALATGNFMTTGQEYPSLAICQAEGERLQTMFNVAHQDDPAMFQCVQKVNR